ncbi:hypothetical protein PTSG_09983 [Salpingoeca rosetta]|uniref:Transcription factor Dp-1 n=1 Tax=Salpingoeca rosetta (strain ATCC 50818 / BSB-021) TaxID=946362 RepID=F2UNQ4_SALR5|nr:uncharacterized protein PTSG_09983 [Salpingoeca rosetta]EGD79259.1 hypothetical protein PTSG_09983 [Salpingoeca rosetta]|eukprot:XP_004989344.1 hypothetical protein PTSG_09983 [Salpingoeca rosetta]
MVCDAVLCYGDCCRPTKRRKSKVQDSLRHRGLKHFSTCVCQKVQEKGVTTYNEVADELVREQQSQAMADGDTTSEPKNIRRRVYDALNVLMALNIISKERKEIKWIGLPTNSEQEYKQYEELKAKKLESIRRANEQLNDLILQQIAFKNLIKRNEQREQEQPGGVGDASKVQLPFIVVNTSKDAVVDCFMSHDRTEYLFKFNTPFEIHDDVDILKRMGLAFGIEEGTCTDEEVEEAKKMIPTALAPFLEDMVKKARIRAQARGTAGNGADAATASATGAGAATGSALGGDGMASGGMDMEGLGSQAGQSQSQSQVSMTSSAPGTQHEVADDDDDDDDDGGDGDGDFEPKSRAARSLRLP